MERRYKDSGIEWIGEIPEAWSCLALLRLLKGRITDGPHETPTLQECGIPFISVDSLNESDSVNLSIVKKFISQEQYEEYQKKAHIEKGDILFSKAATIGKTAIVKDEIFMVWSPLAILKPSSDVCSYKYLYYILNCDGLIKYVSLLGTNNTQINVGMRALEKAIVPKPSIVEQQKIANYLDKKCVEIDSLIGLQEQMIEKLEAYKQSVITEAVTKGLDPNAKLVPSGIDWIGEIPIHWEIQRLKTLGWTQNGISQSGDYFGDEFEYPFVSYSDVYKHFSVPSPKGRANSSEKDRKTYSLIEGDVLFTRTSETIEEIGFSSTCLETIEDAVFSGFLIRFRPTSKKIFKGYSKYYFRSLIHRAYFVKQMNIVTRASLGQDLLKNLIVLLPPIDEQRAIASYLDEKCSEIDHLIAIKQQKMEKLKEYKKSVIFEAVTGKPSSNFN